MKIEIKEEAYLNIFKNLSMAITQIDILIDNHLVMFPKTLNDIKSYLVEVVNDLKIQNKSKYNE